jgi:outer membrane protein insertion porin family
VAAQDVKKVVDVDVVGNRIEGQDVPSLSKEAILALVSTKVGDDFSQTKVDADRAKLEATGYFRRVPPPLVTDVEGGVRVTFVVDPYPPVKDVQVQFEGGVGATIVTEAQIKEALGIKPGDLLNRQKLDIGAEKISNLYLEKGYRAVVVDAPVSDQNVLTVVIKVLQVGAVEVVGPKEDPKEKPGVFRRGTGTITVHGLIKTRPYVVVRELRLWPGQIFNEEALREDVIRLSRLDIFENIQPQLRPTEDGQVAVVYELRERKTGEVNVGVGYGAREGLVGTLSARDVNFLGRGEQLLASYELGGTITKSSFEFGYTKPWIDKKSTTLEFRVYDRNIYRFSTNLVVPTPGVDTNQYSERRAGFTLGLTRPLDRKQFTRATLGFRTESVRSDEVPGVDTFIRQNGRVNALNLRVNRDTRYSPQPGNPTTGIYRSIFTEWGNASVNEGNAGSFGKLALDVRHYFQLDRFKSRNPVEQAKQSPRVIALRVTGGVSTGNLAFWEQYFVGGADSLRGYTEDRFWGRNMLLASAEYRHPLGNRLIGVLFADVGDAWGTPYHLSGANADKFLQTDTLKLNPAAGVGLRVPTPIGPIRLDWAFGSEGSRTHFSIGHQF